LQLHLTLQIVTHNLTKPHFSLKKLNLKNIKGKVWRKFDKVTPMMSLGEMPMYEL
jgi:hypothetical protein